ncbi:MAG: DNA replication/repair protein RecF [Gammaproteobacteria bacterium]|nr:DNA replication/repair protein RecF [Gammaproteobacteria bacterium]
MLSQISISNLRNITEISLQPASGINLILGDNGAGKTSILEAIHLLALGRSFKARTLKTTIKFGQKQLQVIARIANDTPVGVQFNEQSGLKIRLNSAPLKRLSELAMQLPLQFIPANCHQFFEQGPRYRRQLLDWGLFHVEPSFNFHWQSYKKILQQRNSAIRQHKKIEEIQLWDEHLAEHGEKITELRRLQLDAILQEFEAIFQRLCPEYQGANFAIKYRTGWNKDKKLKTSLQDAIERDRQLGYTRSGSHAADWSFTINDFNPAEVFSRGQQKLFFLALCMAQAKITEHVRREKSILLLDDISSELDSSHQKNVLDEMATLPVQAFITATDHSLDLHEKVTVFHVKQGAIL